MSDINYAHPTSVGAGTQPETSRAPPESRISGNRADTRSPPPPRAPDGAEYPEQRHAGAVGIGPNYSTSPTMGEKFSGLKEEVKGKVSGNPALAEQGHKRRTGELKREQRTGDPDGLATSQLQKEKSHMEQAATVAPEGTDEAHTQSRGEAATRMKQI